MATNMSDKIKVAIRVRPLIEREELDGLPLRWITKDNTIYQIDPTTRKIKGDTYKFDHIFGASESNKNVFDSIIKPIIDASMQGFNGTVFAYGQTSSGKTYTMSGDPKCLGIIQMAINYIFYSIENTPRREFLLRVSYMEIYNEKVNDLLDLSKKNLKIQEDCNGQVIVSDVEERVCKNSSEVLEEKMKGDKNRRIGETNMNERSSRSHTIFRIILESRSTDDEDGAVKVSHLNLVDLAGSERSGQSGATGDRFKEGCHINMSLTTLGIVINQLSEVQEGQNQFINFRDSKLTRLLQSSLGGNAMTVIVCAVTPAAEDQTQNTLSFASRAKKINNKPMLNEVLSESALIKRYVKQIAKLNQELEAMKQKSGISEVESMSNKLKEKEEINKVLNERISRLKEALIVSSSSPARKRQKTMPREKRRHSWGGLFEGSGAAGRMSFPGRMHTLTTIEEQSPSAISPPQANSTRLDDTMCPFEKFELELMRNRKMDDSDMIRDSIVEDSTITETPAAAPSQRSIYNNFDKSVDMTLVSQGRATPRNEGTPPFVLRQRLNSMSSFVEDFVKEYDELREFTTLEKQFHTEEINNIIQEQKDEITSLKNKLESTEEKLRESDDKITSLENELFIYKENVLKMEDQLLKNSDENLLKELAELKKVNAKIEAELKAKSDDLEKLKEKADEVNNNYVKVTAEKDKLQSDMRELIKKVKELETMNSDLEVTLDHKSRKSIERETELENELKAAWQALESREKVKRDDVILQKVKINEPAEKQIDGIADDDSNEADCESDTTLNGSNSVEPNEDGVVTLNGSTVEPTDNETNFNVSNAVETNENETTLNASNSVGANDNETTLNVSKSVELTENHTTFNGSNSVEPAENCTTLNGFNSVVPTVNEITVNGFNSIESTEHTDEEPCDATLSNTTMDLNATETHSNFVSCDGTFSNMSILSPVETADPLQSFCLSESMIPVQIPADDDKMNSSAVENELLIQDLREMLGEKDEIKQKIIEMKSEAANILKQYEEKKCDLTRMAEEISSYTAFINSVKQALNLNDEQGSLVEIEKEINNLKATKDNMEDNFKMEIGKLQAELDRTRGFEQVVEELSKMVDTDSTSESNSETDLTKKIADVIQSRTSFLSKLTSIVFEDPSEKVTEDDLVHKVHTLHTAKEELTESYNRLEKELEIERLENHAALEQKSQLEEKLENLLNALEIAYNTDPIEFSLVEAEKLYSDAHEYYRQIVELHDFIGEKCDENELTCEAVKNTINEKTRAYKEIMEQMDTLEGKHAECATENQRLKVELEEKSTVMNQLISSIQTSIDTTCNTENVATCMEAICKELTEIRNSLKEQSTDDEVRKDNLQKEIDVLVEKVEKYETFIMNAHLVLNKDDEIDQAIDEKSKTILLSIESGKVLESQLREQISSLVKYKDVLEKMFAILNDNSEGAIFSIENVLEEIAQYKTEFLDMQNDVDKLEDCQKRVLELENQVRENEVGSACLKYVLGRIRCELDLAEDHLTVESLPGLMVEMKNQAQSSSNRLQKLEEFVDDCEKTLNVYCDISADDKLSSIVDNVHKLVLDIENINEENMSLKQYKEVMLEIFEIFEDNTLTIESVIPVLTGYKSEFCDMRIELEKVDGRTSELEKQFQDTETKLKYLAEVFEKILAEFVDEDVKIESILEKIIQMKSQFLSISDLAQKLQQFVNSCVSALGIENDLPVLIDDRLSSIIVIIQQLAVLKSEDNSLSIKQQETLEKIIQTLSEDGDDTISVENVLEELLKYKTEFVEMHEKLEKTDEYASEMANLKSKYNDFVQVFDKIATDFEGDLEIEMLPEAINKLKNELNELNKFKLDVHSIVKNQSANESDVFYTTEELISAIEATNNKISSLNGKLDSVQEENARLAELSSNFDMKLKEYMSIEGIISSLGTDLGSEMQVKIDEIVERQIQSPELNQQIGKLIEFNRAYLEMEDKLSKTVDDMKAVETTLKNVQCVVEAEDVDNIENAVKDLKNQANELTMYKNLINEISGQLSAEQEPSNSPENLLSSVVGLKDQISTMTEKMETLEARNVKLSEAFEDLDNKMKHTAEIEQVVSGISSILEVDSTDNIVTAVEDLKKSCVDLKNDAAKISMDKDNYLHIIQSLLNKLSGDVDVVMSTSDVELRESVISKAESVLNEVSRLKELLNGIKQLLSDLSEVDLQLDDDVKLEDVKHAMEDIKKNLCEVYELKHENMNMKTEFESMKEKMQAHFECVDIVFNLCNLLSETVGKTVAKCEILKIVGSLLQKGTIPLNESSVIDMEESVVKVSEIDNLRIELNDLKTSLAKMFDVEDPTTRDNLLELVNNLKNDHANLVSKYDSLQSECVIYKDSLGEVVKSVFENVSNDISLDERVKLLTERVLALKEVENSHGEILSRNQMLTVFQNSITEELGLTNSTMESAVEALKMLKTELENNQKDVDESKIQLDAISSEKNDLKEKVDSLLTVIRENIPSDDQESNDFYKCKQSLLKMIEDYNIHVQFYNDLCVCLSDRVEDLSKESLRNTVAAIKEDNNCLNKALQEMSANNEKIISDLNSAYESVMSKLDLTKENEKTLEELKVMMSGGDLLESVRNLIEDKSKMDSRLQEMMSEIGVMKSGMTEKQNVHCELDKCLSLLRAISTELEISDGENHNELLEAISELKSKSDQTSEELSCISEQLRKYAEELHLQLSKINGEEEKEHENIQLLSSKCLLEQLKSDWDELVNLYNCNQALVSGLKSENDKLSETVKNLNAEFERIRNELELQSDNDESAFDSIKMLKETLQQITNENATVKATNEELNKISESLKLELDESVKNGEQLKSDKENLNMQIKDNLETIDHLRTECENVNVKLTNSLDLIGHKDETICTIEKQVHELKNDIKSNEKLIEGLKNEVADQQKAMEDLRNEKDRIEASAKTTEEEGEVKTKIEDTLKELEKVNQKLDELIAVDKTLKKKLITEIKNLKSDFEPKSDEETSVQLLDSFVSVIVEKYQEVITTLNQNFEAKNESLKEKINQLESKEKKTKEWIEQIEAEADSTNQDINAKSVEIERLNEIVKKQENELIRKTEDLESIRETMKTCEAELISLRSESQEIVDKLKSQLSEQNLSATDSLKLKESLEKTIEERDALSNELNNKKADISRLQTTVDTQQQELKSYFNKLNEQQVRLGENDTILSNLRDKNEACLQEIEDLKQELKKEKDECDRLSSSLNTLTAEYEIVQQTLETNKKANEALESKLEEVCRDMNDTKTMAANLVESLKNEEQKALAQQKSLEKINEEKTNECNDLKTKLHLLQMEISKHNSNTMSKEEVEAVNKVNKELRDEIVEKEKQISNKQNECQRLESEIADMRQKYDNYSRTLSLLQSDVIKKDQELVKLENLKAEAIKMSDCLRGEEAKCAALESKNSLLEKDLIDRSNQITKLQLMLGELEKQLQEMRADENVKLDLIKVQLKEKEDLCNGVSNTVALQEKQKSESEKMITKLKSDIICKDEDLSKMRKELSRLTASLEEANRYELKHQPKKLKRNTLNKFENFGGNEKENDVCLKLNTSHNTQSGGCLKCRKLEKEMGLLFKVEVGGEVLVEKMKQSLTKLEEFESKYNTLQAEYKELDAECEDLNTQIKSLEAECTNLVYKRDELTVSCDKLKEENEKELVMSATLKKKNENLTKDLDACRVELERYRELVKSSRRERNAAMHGSFRESKQPMDLSASGETPSTPNAADFKSIKHRWEQMSTSTQKQQSAPAKECNCEELTKQNQELKVELADKNNKVTLLEIQIQGQNFPYKKKAATLEEALNEAKTKIMTLKQEVRRLQTCLHDVSVFQSCETCRNKAKTVTTETGVQTTVTDTEASVSGSDIVQRQSMNILKEKTAKLERENMLLKRLCRDRNRKIESLEHDLKAGSGPKT